MADEKRDFKGIWIPKEIWLNEELSAIEKIVWAEIDSLDSSERGCYMSNEHLAKFCQCSERTISSAISKLEKLKYITITSFDGRRRNIQSSIENIARQGRKYCEAESQNNAGHNSIYNIYNNTKDKIDNNSTPKISAYEELFQQLWKLYPNKKGVSSVSVKSKKRLLEIGYEKFANAIQCYKDEIAKNNTEEKYIKYGSTFFNSGYVDYLDKENVVDEKTELERLKETDPVEWEKRRPAF